MNTIQPGENDIKSGQLPDAHENVARIAEGSLQILANAVPSIVWTCRADGRADFFNDRWFEFTGNSADESLGLGWSKTLHPDDHDRVLATWQQSIESCEPYETELRYRRVDGKYRWHLVRAVPVFNDTRKVDQWFGISTDIDDRTQTQETLQARTQAIVETAVDAIITIDKAGIIDSVNPSTERLFGYSMAEMTGQNVSMLMPEPYRSQHGQYLASYIETGEKKIIGIGREVQGRRKDGSTFPMDLAVSEIKIHGQHFFTGIVHDLTTRKNSEDALAERESFLQTIFDTEPECVKILGEGGLLKMINRAGLDMIEVDSYREVGDKSVFPLISPKDRKAFESLTDRVLTGESGSLEFEIVGHRGTHRFLETHAVPLRDASGEITSLLAISRDVTDRKRAEEDARLAQDQLVQSERLAAMGQMLSVIAHESRNVLQRLQAGVDMLQLAFEHDSQEMNDLNRIVRAKDDLTRLFEELRSYAAPIQLDVSSVNLDNVWRRAWVHLETSRSEQDSELIENTNVNDLTCQVDLFRIGQVFRNLFENSLAACKEPVRIHINCAESNIAGKPALCITLRDNGPGFTDEQRERLFEAFYTTKAKGTGLGMAIVQRIIEAHGGTIAVGESGHDGAEIEITLPRKIHD